jgi:hypothetical protein
MKCAAAPARLHRRAAPPSTRWRKTGFPPARICAAMTVQRSSPGNGAGGGLSPRPLGHVHARDLDAVGNGRHMHFSLLDVDDSMFQQFGSTAYTVSTWVMPLVIAVTFHEASHGYVARLCGDDTAWRLGRVSFNPFKHIDPFGTILLPALLLLMRSPFLFGYAKPVPVNFRALRKPRRDMIWVAAAGPAMHDLEMTQDGHEHRAALPNATLMNGAARRLCEMARACYRHQPPHFLHISNPHFKSVVLPEIREIAGVCLDPARPRTRDQFRPLTLSYAPTTTQKRVRTARASGRYPPHAAMNGAARCL